MFAVRLAGLAAKGGNPLSSERGRREPVCARAQSGSRLRPSFRSIRAGRNQNGATRSRCRNRRTWPCDCDNDSPRAQSPLQRLVFSCGEQLPAALADAELACRLNASSLRDFLEQRRKHQQRKRRDPSQRGGFVGRATQSRVEFRRGCRSESLLQEPVFEPFQFRFLDRAERPDLEPRLRAESSRHSSVFQVHFSLSFELPTLVGSGYSTKNPRLTGNRGFFEKSGRIFTSPVSQPRLPNAGRNAAKWSCDHKRRPASAFC